MRGLDRAPRRARVEPHVEHVGLLAKRARLPAGRAAMMLGEEILDRPLVPKVRAAGPGELGRAPHHVRIEMRLAATLATHRRNARAPGVLAGYAAVGARANRLANAILRGLGVPTHWLVDRRERTIAMTIVIDDHEPLIGGPEDHRVVAPPAVRVRVPELARRE